MRPSLCFAALAVSVAIACSSGPHWYEAGTLIPVPARAADSLRDLVVTRVRDLGFTVYQAQDALTRLAEINVGVFAPADFLYADRENGCGLNCKQVDGLLVSLEPDSAESSEQLKVTALTCKRGWISPWRLVHPSDEVRHAAATLASRFRS